MYVVCTTTSQFGLKNFETLIFPRCIPKLIYFSVASSGPLQASADLGSEGQLRIVSDWEHEVSLERTSYRVLESTSQIAAEMFPVLSRQQTHIGGDLINRYEWMYSPATRVPGNLGMKVDFTPEP